MALRLLKTLLFHEETIRNEHNYVEECTKITAQAATIVNQSCRVCRGPGDIDIFSPYKERNLAEDIRLCSGVPVYLNDGLPSFICEGCLTLLQYSVKFREMCRCSAEKLLKVNPGRTQESETAIKDVYDTENYCDEWDYAPLSPEADLPEPSADTKTCSTCQQEFDDMHAYRKHHKECRISSRKKKKKRDRKSHHHYQEHLCETCGKSLSSIHSLISHRTIHQNIFPFKCDLCQYRGKTAGLLRTHRKIHFSEKPHACSMCPKAFRTSSNLRKHLQVHRGQQEAVQCSLCDKTLRNKETLRGHVRSVHANRPPVTCNLCGKLFKGMRALYKHRSKVHNWRAEYTGRLPAYMLCQPEDPETSPPPPPPEHTTNRPVLADP